MAVYEGRYNSLEVDSPVRHVSGPWDPGSPGIEFRIRDRDEQTILADITIGMDEAERLLIQLLKAVAG